MTTIGSKDQRQTIAKKARTQAKATKAKHVWSGPLRRGAIRTLDSFIALVIAIGIWWGIESIDGKGILFYFSTPPKVYHALGSILTSAYFWHNFWSTAEATLIAFAIGSILGIVIGFIVTTVPRVECAIEPFASMFNSLPRIALAPVFIVMLGIGQTSKIVVGISLVVFVLYYNTRAGVKSTDRDWLLMGQTLGFSRWQMFHKIQGPAAWPTLFSGLRLGFTYGLLGVVSTEIIAARAGLGLLVEDYSSELLMAQVYAVLLVLAVAAGVVYWLTGLVEKNLQSWR